MLGAEKGNGPAMMPVEKKHWLWDTPKAQHNEEVRASVRFPLQLPVRVESDDHNWVNATAENISASGFLFLSERDFPSDAKLEFSIQMPAAVMGTPTDVVVHGSARVVRSYKKEPLNCIAAVIDDYAFEAALGSHAVTKQ
jgi:hypothetical protein